MMIAQHSTGVECQPPSSRTISKSNKKSLSFFPLFIFGQGEKFYLLLLLVYTVALNITYLSTNASQGLRFCILNDHPRLQLLDDRAQQKRRVRRRYKGCRALNATGEKVINKVKCPVAKSMSSVLRTQLTA